MVKRTVDTADATRGAIDPGSAGGQLSRQRYVLWCLALAVLHQEGRQTTLQRLAEAIVRLAESIPELVDAGIETDLKLVRTRRAIVCVVRLLLEHTLLVRIEGNEAKFGESESVDCLYNIDTTLLTDLLFLTHALPTSNQPTTIAQRLSALAPATLGDDDGPRPRDLEHRLIGQLLENPILYFSELTEREFQYWQSQRQRLLQVIEQATGLIAELRYEGVALLDPFGTLTDVKIPDAGTVGHATLLLSEILAVKYRGAIEQDDVTVSVSIETLQAELTRLAEEHKSHWRSSLLESGQISVLLAEVLERLEMLRLVRRQGESVIPLAAVCRFAVDDGSGGK